MAGVPVVFVPGLMCTGRIYQHQVESLADTHPVLLANHWSQPTMGEIAAQILGNAPDQFALVGTSMGGYVAFEIMRQAPNRVAGLVLIDTTARPETSEASAKREVLIKLAESDLDAVTEQLLPRLSHPDRMNLPAVRGVIQAMATSLGKEVFQRQQRAIMGRADSRPTLAGIACPTLVICGHDDVITPPELAKEMADGIRHAKLEIIAECGHLATLDQPEEVNRLLLDWISSSKF